MMITMLLAAGNLARNTARVIMTRETWREAKNTPVHLVINHPAGQRK